MTQHRTHPVVAEVTARLVERSSTSRAAYLRKIRDAAERGPARTRLACANLAHGFAASDDAGKAALRGRTKPNLAIVSSYNDMLSAHQPFETYPPVQAGGDPRRRHRAVRRGRPGDVRRDHPGPRRHAAVAVQP